MSGTAENGGGEAGQGMSGQEDEAVRGGDGGAAGGGVQIGNLSGGAVAAGQGARAEDRGRRPAVPPGAGVPAVPGAPGAPGVPSAPVPPPPSVPPPLPGGINIGTMSGGAVAQGPQAQAVDSSIRFGVAADAEALATSLRALRAELLAQPPSATAVADEQELIELETEARAGRGDRTRLERLRDRLELGQFAATGGAAAAAAVESIGRLLG
ncbi:hypothetical protein [Streptomyces sp. 184]|uniref:hypothetical protein n=1 Tax=Streptomyces sp. 184 TaxID=1827526 RepID=UPI0038929487